ncbi:MAG: DUF4330 family protein [Eubacteriales bacterium]
MKKEKMKFRLNVFDTIVLLVALALGGVFLWQTLSRNETVVVQRTEELHYQIMIKEASGGTGDIIPVGSAMLDAVKNYNIGTVQGMEVLPATKQVLNHETKEYQQAILEGAEDILIDMVVQVSLSDSALMADGGFPVRVGELVYLRGAGYMAAGYIYSIERFD